MTAASMDNPLDKHPIDAFANLHLEPGGNIRFRRIIPGNVGFLGRCGDALRARFASTRSGASPGS